MRNTFLDRPLAPRIALVAGFAGLLAIACSGSKSNSGDDTTGGGETGGGAGDQGTGTSAGGNANPAGTGGQAAAGSTGAGGSNATGGASGSGGAGGTMAIADAGPRTSPLKIMALGDSTTEFTCYRAELAKLLDKSHPKDYQYVGTRVNDFGGCGGYVYDKHNQGMSAYLVSSTTGAMNTHAEAPTWAAVKPDVVLLHFATNDAWNGFSPTKILPAYSYLVDEFRKQNPRVKFIVAQLIPLDPMGADGGKTCSTCPNSVKALNAALPDWAKMTTTAASPVTIVDQWTGYDAAVDNCAPTRCDGVHPGPTGSVKMAAKWDEALEPLF
jgi:lysophospholipase L1-like esterase